MGYLLRIDSSSRRDGSRSRHLADDIEAAWRRRNRGATVINRDLAADPMPHISAATIAGFYTPEDQHTDATRTATALSDALIAELQAADAVLFGVPMYNFSIPSALKAYFDQIVRAGRTFGHDPAKGFFGLVESRPVYVAAVYGAGGYASGDLKPYDHLEPYLRNLLGLIGLTDVTFFSIEGTVLDPALAERDKAHVHSTIDRIFAAAT